VNAAFQTALPEHLPLAASPQLAENSRLGFEPVASTSRWGFSFAISSHTLGLSGSLDDGRVRSRSTGKERDTESGNDYFDARYYSSAMGRFMSPDWSAKEDPVPYAQIDDPQSLNLYSYVRNNPLTRIDPDGHFSCGGENAKGISCQFLNNWDKEHGVGQDGAQQQGLTTQSQNAIGSAAAKYHYDAKTFTAALLGAAGKNGVDPNILVGLGYRESSLNPSAKNGGLFQIQDPSAYGIKPGDIGSFAAQLPAAANVLSSNIKAFHGNVDLGIASWTLGVGGTRHLFSTGGMQAVRSAWLDRNHHDYGTVGPDYVDIIDKFEH